MIVFSLPILIMLLAAIVPAIFLLKKVYKYDRLEKEPTSLIVKLVFLGIISTACALLTETIGSNILNNLFEANSLAYNLIMYFIVVALSEEGFKYLILKRATWKNPNFNCTFDAVVYAVSVSLGFALWENIQYVFSYGLTTALVRAVTAVPGHASFGVLMGACYGAAKRCESRGELDRSKRFMRSGLILPVLAHGFYDFCASMGGYIGSIAFLVVILVLFFICSNLVKGLSEGDEYINNDPDFTYK